MQTRFLFGSFLFVYANIVVAAGLSTDLAADLPHYGVSKHMGVATCASSACHARTDAASTGNVRQNEYLTWLLHDRHSQAFNTLLSPESQKIAQKLGLKNATTANICLDCHADNVPAKRRGAQFQISDGVGCESCHGGAEKWLGPHTLTPYSLARNREYGMYPTADLEQRANLCASCHVGDQNKLATHRIMGAGHPRLGFELDTLSIRQPEHYTVDDDFLSRKNPDNHLQRLLVGTAVQAHLVAQNLMSKLVDHPQGHPELALFDCHSCHHSLSEQRWKQRPSTQGLQPGSIRVNDSSFLLLAALGGALAPSLERDVLTAVAGLHNASASSIGQMQASAEVLKRLARSALEMFEQSSVSTAQAQAMIENIARLGVRGEYQDYMAAEQAVMAIDALAANLPEDTALAVLLDRVFKLTENDEAYEPERLQQTLRRYLSQ